jgi:hypothetical protein
MTKPNHTFPRGEQVVAMAALDLELFVATTSRVWTLDHEGVLRPVEIQAEAGAGESQVFAPPDLGA